MATRSLAQRNQISAPSSRRDTTEVALDLRGLDMVTPVDLLDKGHTPYAKNFRLHAEQSDSRKVAVSSRKGPGYYTDPLAETLVTSNTSTTGASTAPVGYIENVHAFSFVAGSSDRLTRVDIEVGNTVGQGPLMVRIYDGATAPTNLLAESSISDGEISIIPGYEIARFLNAPKLTSGQTYWVVLEIQDDGSGSYNLVTTTAGTKAWKTSAGLSQLVQQPYALHYKLYVSQDTEDKGAYRFNKQDGANVSLVAYNDTMYVVDETTHALKKLIGGLYADAKEYRFANGDGKVFWVNASNDLTAWNGVHEDAATNKILNGTFETNTTGWVAGAGTTLTSTTAQFKTGTRSMLVSAATGNRIADYTTAFEPNRRYKMTVSLYSGGGTTIIEALGTPSNLTISSAADTANTWVTRDFYFTPTSARTAIRIYNGTNDFYVDDVRVVDTGIEYILDTELPILADVTMHKNRLMGVTAADRNKIVFSEEPGNPAFKGAGLATPTVATEQWYYAWLSVSYMYVPRPMNGSPITGIISFQDNLVVFTQDMKYTISGSDRGSYFQREATGNKGALSARGIAVSENELYFVADDGFYAYKGSGDEKISKAIAPLFDGCGHKDKISPVIWKNQVRFYMASQGSPYNDICAIWNKDLEEWVLDTDTHVNRAIYYKDADDNGELIEFSSLVPTAYVAETSYDSLGGPIDFEYRLKYDSMGLPAQRKRLKRYYPILQGVDKSFRLGISMDKDFEDSPRIKEVLMTVNGAKIGEFTFGDGTLLGGDASFKPHRQSYSGYANYWQLRVHRKGVDNRVAFIGAQYSYKAKRL